MHPASLVIATAALALLAALSLAANRRLRHLGRLPMHWGLAGQVTWTAPRPLALALVPILAAIMLLASALSGAPPLMTALMALALIAAHLAHLWLIRRTALRGTP
ncbi:hypothetical protein [Frigidibacter mobilis]|uniref:DUF1648 domain-containing protein n=1 Tax=Frigidibacter mobilis TaxID=1335048 RepID=A0A161HC47_9RHOB|nr:hypothetical protein [Frigidibacter mobilis]AMY69349.1 hypothetical protein AKL17_2103 [Frigidibacter mobilis]